MDSGLEEMGALGTAAVAASVLDGPGAPGAGHDTHCRNCSAALAGPFCSACGQKAHLHRSMLQAAEEFLHGIVHFDGRFWNTLPLLIFRPGKLTRDYVMGKRARYIAPVAVFLLTIFAMFFVFSLLGSSKAPDGMIVLDEPMQQGAALASANTGIAELDREIREAGANSASVEKMAALKAARTAAAARDRIATGNSGKGSAPGAKAESVGEALTHAVESGDMDIAFGQKELDQKIREALRQPEFMFYKMQQKGYKLSFLLVPLSLPWMWLLFAWKKDVKAYDHVVFLLYSISFMSMLFMLTALCAALGVTAPQVYGLLFVVIPIVHIYVQLKGGYQLSRFSAAWRTVALSLLAVLTLLFYVAGIALLGLLD